MNPVRVGIIGFGRIGEEHAGRLKQCRGITAIAVADETFARRELARKQGLAVHEDYQSLIANGSVDAVLIATPTSMHFDHAAAALRAKKHVMVEKPMAMNLQEATQLVELAKSHQRVLSVFHNRRWDPDFLAVGAAIGSGVFGKIINVESRLGQWASCVGPAAKEYRPNWRNEASFGGGGLFDWGSHFLDQLWRLMLPARPLRVFAQLRGSVWSQDCDDFARICLDFDNGAVGMVEINTTTTQPLPRWHIDGTAGSAHSPHSPEFDVSRWAQLEFIPAGGGSPRPLPAAPPGLTNRQIWEHFAQAISGQSSPAVTAESVLPTMAILDAARQSSRSGRTIDLSSSFLV